MNISDEILNFLFIHGPSTAHILSKSLDRTVADIRYQLNNFLLLQQIVRSSPQHTTKPGRPATLFSIVPVPPQRLYKALVNGLIISIFSPECNPANEEKISSMIENELTKDFVPQGSSVTRIKQMIEYLSKYGVHAKWQAGKLGPEFVLIDEIISKIINHQPLSDLILSKTMACLLRKALNSPD